MRNILEFVNDFALYVMESKRNGWLILLLENGNTQVSSLDSMKGLDLRIVTGAASRVFVTDWAAREFSQLGLGID